MCGLWLYCGNLNAPNGIRIHVYGLKGRCPRPLDDGGKPINYSRESYEQTMDVAGYHREHGEEKRGKRHNHSICNDLFMTALCIFMF
jgi:hypothetical protein